MTAPIPPLFGGPLRGSVGTPAVPTGPLHLVEFRAGRMTLRDRMVTPDRRKGLIYVFQSDDGLAHFCWKDRTSGTVEEDLIIFPDDVTFEKLSAEKSRGGRVFLLRFKSNPARKFFFWCQEPRAENDESLCERVLEAINNPTHVLATMMSSRGGDGSSSARGGGAEQLLPPGAVSPGAFTEADLQALLGAYSPQQLLSWMSGSGATSRPTSGGLGGLGAAAAPAPAPSSTSTASAPAAQPEATPTTTQQQPAVPAAPAAAPAPTSQLPSTPASTTAPPPSGAAAPRRPGAADLAAALRAIGATMQGKSESSQSPPLSDILAADAVISSATAPGTVTDRLIAHLPPGTGLPGDEELIASLRSPQFQQAANMLSAALETGQLGPLLMEMGVAREAVAGVHDVETFLRALQQHAGPAPTTPATTNGSSNGAPKAPSAPKKEKESSTGAPAAADATNGAQKKDSNGDGNGSSPMEH